MYKVWLGNFQHSNELKYSDQCDVTIEEHVSHLFQKAVVYAYSLSDQKVQVSFSNSLFSDVRPSVCMSVCKKKNFPQKILKNALLL